MRKFIRIGVLLLIPALGTAQRNYVDSLRTALRNAPNDSVRYSLNMQIGYYFQESERDSAVHYYNVALRIARKHDQKIAQAGALGITGYQLALLGRYARSLQCLQDAFSLIDESKSGNNSWVFSPDGSKPKDNRLYTLSRVQLLYSVLMHATNNTGQQIFYLHESIKNAKRINDPYRIAIPQLNLGRVYLKLHKLDSALLEENAALKTLQFSADKTYMGTILTQIGTIYLEKQDMPMAKKYFHEGWQWLIRTSNRADMAWAYFGLTSYYLSERDKDSSLVTAKKTLQVVLSIPTGDKDLNIDDVYQNLSLSYRLNNQPDSVTKYQAKALAAKDSIYRRRIKDLADFQNLGFRQQMHLRDVEKEKLAYQSRVRIYSFAGAALAFLAIGFILWRNNKKQKQINHLLGEQKEEISAQRDQLEGKNHELEIEAALEKVRAVAMGMHTPDDLLKICEALYKELQLLEFVDLRNAIIHTYSIGNYFIDYDYSDFTKGHVNRIPYKGNPILEKFVQDIRKTKDAFTEVVITGNELKEWKNFRDANNEAPDERLAKNFSLYYYIYSVGSASIGISTFNPIPTDKLEVLKRFRNVFDLAYKRYLDITKAEAQAREAQIEASLERVRSRAMAMHKTDDLLDAAELLYKELTGLGIKSMAVTYSIMAGDEKSAAYYSINPVDGKINPVPLDLAHTETKVMRSILSSWKKQETFSKLELDEKATLEHQTYIAHKIQAFFAKHDFDYNFSVEAFLAVSPPKAVIYTFNFEQGYIFIIGDRRLTAEQEEMVLRFTKVFELTYRRFLDIKQAEEQARESQIQLALERIRARTMAMQKSEELAETVFILFQQFKELGEHPDQATIGIINEEEKVIEYWVTMYGKQNDKVYKFSIDEPNVTRKIYNAWKHKKKSLIIDLSGKALLDFAAYRQSMGGARLNKDEKRRIINVAFFSKGLINVQSTEERSEESIRLLERFAGVFDGTYTRFLDLKKAEAQAREGQIQLGLERVRAAAMAMHDSAGVGDATALVFTELYKLGISTIRCGVCIVDGPAKEIEVWSASQQEGKISRGIGRLDMTAHPLWMHLLNAWKAQIPSFTYELKGKELADYYHIIRTASGYHAPDNKGMYNPAAGIANEKQYCNCYIFREGCLFTFTHEPFSTETGQVLEKFAAVFGLTYRRYLDLQRAEAQAREAQIEAALERVRSKTMAMHNSADVADTAAVMFDELVKLGVEKAVRCGIGILNRDSPQIEVWTAKAGENEKPELIIGHFDTNIHPLLKGVYDAWYRHEHSFSYVLADDDRIKYYESINEQPDYPIKYDISIMPSPHYNSDFFFAEGVLYVFTSQPLSEEINSVFKRFAGVFGQTYRRYLDLQKAEAQAREAQIEASLERVRGKAMAMRTSGDLSAAASTVFTELRNLGINPIRSGVGLLSKETHNAKIYSDTSLQKDTDLSLIGEVDLSLHHTFEQQYQSWLKQENYFVELGGKELTSYYKIVSAGLNADLGVTIKKDQKQYGHWFMFSEGFLYAWSDKHYTEAEVRILERFKNVIALTFRRYVELQKSEANAKEAIKQASLDRVRAEIASMRKRSDLERITPLIWNELTILGIPFIRCGVFIMDEKERLIHTFLSTPDGKAIGAFHVPFDTSGNFEKMVDSWRHNVPYIDHWKEEAFSQFADTLVKQGAIASKAQYMKTLPHEGVYLNFLPFLQGMLYVGNKEPISEENINLVQAVADAFSTAYARYEDFNKLEAAKQQVDNTLTQLKATQNKLIQSEKMASLGELTAGIAHEIQNPLNFVNNFSEVSAELIDEMEEELSKGDTQEAMAIASDIKQNLEKIRHHGKRADGIVKGMLQHSRASSNVKEPTDINKLADEYLHLAYHGLRAKDKSFNAELVTHFDKKLPKTSVVPQDIGRVILNMINNAFYATQQKAKGTNGEYKPEVAITTATLDGQVTIRVKDNGNGIPDAIRDKIMQPFFTTKPTGEGTGLGLSLSYDIVVKGHGGKINIKSIEGEGSEFIIDLPIA